MSNTIQHKRSTTSGTTPSASDLAVGEIGINTADRTLFTKHSDGTVVSVADVASDATPQLSGNLDMNSNLITNGTGTTQFQYGPGYIDCGTSSGFGLRLGNQGNYSLDISNGEFNQSYGS